MPAVPQLVASLGDGACFMPGNGVPVLYCQSCVEGHRAVVKWLSSFLFIRPAHGDFPRYLVRTDRLLGLIQQNVCHSSLESVYGCVAAQETKLNNFWVTHPSCFLNSCFVQQARFSAIN